MHVDRLIVYGFAVALFTQGDLSNAVQGPNVDPPEEVVKLVFIHHSCGENLLHDADGGLGHALAESNYFVSDTNYGWGPNSIGDLTDIGHWYDWFLGPERDTNLDALFRLSEQNSDYTRRDVDPGGENQVILFKSCFPNAYLAGNPDDPATTGQNPLAGNDAWSEHMTVANAKGIYNDLLDYFSTQQDKLFVAVTAPPLVSAETDLAHAANARGFTNWLMHDWLRDYRLDNVATFDFYNLLTSNGGDERTNDQGWSRGNHHRWRHGQIEHLQSVSRNDSAYGSDEWDSHPTRAGNLKAATELVPLINLYYHCWNGSGTCPPLFEVRSSMGPGPINRLASMGNTIRLSVSAESLEGRAVDWWLVFVTGEEPSPWHSYTLADGWKPGIHVGLQSHLVSFSRLDIPDLPEGAGTLYFGVDLVQDGALSLESAQYDWIPVVAQ